MAYSSQNEERENTTDCLETVIYSIRVILTYSHSFRRSSVSCSSRSSWRAYYIRTKYIHDYIYTLYRVHRDIYTHTLPGLCRLVTYLRARGSNKGAISSLLSGSLFICWCKSPSGENLASIILIFLLAVFFFLFLLLCYALSFFFFFIVQQPEVAASEQSSYDGPFLALMQVTCLPDCRACGSPRDFSQHLTAGYFLFWNPPSCQNISFFIYNILLFIVRLETAAQERDTDPDLLKSDVEFTFYAFHFSKKSC